MQIEVLVAIFTIVDGEFKVLMSRKKAEPYKGYWMLPSSIATKEDRLEDTIDKFVEDKYCLKNLEYEHNYTFDELARNPKKRTIGVSYITIVDSRIVAEIELDESSCWFNVDVLPKMAYDHENIMNKANQILKEKIIQSSTLKKIFPSDFTLPEIGKMYEQVLGYGFDKRNFRKKFMKADLVEETGDKTVSTNGRPAKLYRFKEKIENKLLF